VPATRSVVARPSARASAAALSAETLRVGSESNRSPAFVSVDSSIWDPEPYSGVLCPQSGLPVLKRPASMLSLWLAVAAAWPVAAIGRSLDVPQLVAQLDEKSVAIENGYVRIAFSLEARRACRGDQTCAGLTWSVNAGAVFELRGCRFRRTGAIPERRGGRGR
jgi:hypothetical protein